MGSSACRSSRGSSGRWARRRWGVAEEEEEEVEVELEEGEGW